MPDERAQNALTRKQKREIKRREKQERTTPTRKQAREVKQREKQGRTTPTRKQAREAQRKTPRETPTQKQAREAQRKTPRETPTRKQAREINRCERSDAEDQARKQARAIKRRERSEAEDHLIWARAEATKVRRRQQAVHITRAQSARPPQHLLVTARGDAHRRDTLCIGSLAPLAWRLPRTTRDPPRVGTMVTRRAAVAGLQRLLHRDWPGIEDSGAAHHGNTGGRLGRAIRVESPC